MILYPEFKVFIEILNFISFYSNRGPVTLIKRVKITYSFLQCVKLVPRYHFKLAYVVLQMAVKDKVSQNPLLKMEK